MPPEVDHLDQSDHDLLIRMDEKLNLLINGHNTYTKITDDRIGFLEKIVWSGLGALGLAQFVVFAILKFGH